MTDSWVSNESSEFEVFVSKADFKFNCAHFIIYKGFRERLHGHNYQLSVRVIGTGSLSEDGYLIDFGDIKKATRDLCKKMNEYFICPTRSSEMKITESDGNICIVCEDGSRFQFPRSDCAMLPIVHSSAEELAHYFWCSIIRKIGREKLLARGAIKMEVSVAEAPNQAAIYRGAIPQTDEKLLALENLPLNIRPTPCQSAKEEES